MSKKVLHKRSVVVENGQPKLPTSSQLDIGEIAINYAPEHETISIKNQNNVVVPFSSDAQIEAKINTRISGITMNGTALTVSGGVVDLGSVMTESEELVISAALNDVNDRLNVVSGDVQDVNADVQALSGNVSTLSGNIQTLSSETKENLIELEKKIGVYDYSKQYLTFIALEDGTFKFSDIITDNTLSYSLDGGNTWTALAHNTDTPTVSGGSTIMWKGTGLTISDWGGIGIFASTGRYEVEGNTMSLTHGDNFATATTIQNYEFYALFSSSTGLTSVENLVLPATTLAEACYGYMFAHCTSLTTAPELPATTLANYCYVQMFYDCTSLTTAPVLMVTTLEDSCYMSMFSDCISLTTAPELPATTLTQYCYNSMFYGCTNLNYIKCLATDISAEDCTTDWVDGVVSAGTFVKAPSMTSWTTGVNGIPSGWVVEDNLTLEDVNKKLEDCDYVVTSAINDLNDRLSAIADSLNGYGFNVVN